MSRNSILSWGKNHFVPKPLSGHYYYCASKPQDRRRLSAWAYMTKDGRPSDNAPYQDLGRVLHEPDAGTRVRKAVEVLGLAVQPVADDVAADDLVLDHVRHALHRRFRFGLHHGRRAVARRRPFERRRACQKRTDNSTGIHGLKKGRQSRVNRSARYAGLGVEYRFDVFTDCRTYLTITVLRDASTAQTTDDDDDNDVREKGKLE